MIVDVWLYGVLSQYGGSAASKGFASLKLDVQDGVTLSYLLNTLKMPTTERGITFINGNLSALPDLQPDLNQVIQDGDRISFFDKRSMWPFQYRHGAAMAPGLNQVLDQDPESVMHHSLKKED